MAYGKIGTRVSPGVAAAAPKVGAAMGLGRTNGTMLGGASGRSTAPVNPNSRAQDTAMAKALGLKGADKAVVRAKNPRAGKGGASMIGTFGDQSIARANDPIKKSKTRGGIGGGGPVMRANDPIKRTSNPVPKSRPRGVGGLSKARTADAGGGMTKAQKQAQVRKQLSGRDGK